MQRKVLIGLGLLVLLIIFGTVGAIKNKVQPGGSANLSGQIKIGIEYAVEGQDASVYSALGIAAIKPLPESITWSKMQPRLSGAVDYNVADKFVKDYQAVGFREIVFGLRTLSHANDNGATYSKDRPVPRPEYVDDYASWVKGVVERYDKDGAEDMPGLLYPVHYYEIEVEFSSYTPESVGDYLAKLKVAYAAAHEVYPDVLIAHSAFLALSAFDSDPNSSQYEKAFASMSIPDKHHNLTDMRQVLDHPELFDRLNFHELGDPVMIERTVKWLKYETGRRGYSKPIIISDTAPTPFVSYGPATICKGVVLGIIVWPAKESDRCRLANYFNKILDNDSKTVAWKNWYLAGDLVKKVVVAAGSGVELINTAFTGDLPILNTKLGFAGAGNGGFGGVVSQTYNLFTRKYAVSEYRPGFYALQQLTVKLKDVKSIKREESAANVRLYQLKTASDSFWIGWFHPDYLVLPGDSMPKKTISLPLGSGATTTEMATTAATPKTIDISSTNGEVTVDLSMTPVYIKLK